MATHRGWFGRALLASLSVTACSSPDDAGGSAGATLALEDAPARTAEVTCQLLYRCCTSEERAGNPNAGSTEAECRTSYTELIGLDMSVLAASVEAGRSHYDGSAYAACLTEAEAGGCESAAANLQACDDVVSPRVEPSGACTLDVECVDGVCLGESGSSDGNCGAPLAVGAVCEESSDCASEACPTGFCSAKVGEGESCAADPECLSGRCDKGSFTCVAAAPASICD